VYALCVCVCVCVQDEVLIAGFGRRGHAVGDIPGVRFKVRQPGAGWTGGGGSWAAWCCVGGSQV
jgi:hypothetical protein